MLNGEFSVIKLSKIQRTLKMNSHGLPRKNIDPHVNDGPQIW